MLRVTWIQEPGVIGIPPAECAARPGFADCFGEQFKAALAEPECLALTGAAQTACIAYYADLRTAQNCKNICPEAILPIKPGQWPLPAPPPPRRVPSTPTAPKKSSTGPVLIGLGLAALALVAITASS